jgi:uncharacterized alpha/beta hydrolase family protein
MDQTFTLLPIILKALIKSEKSPDAISIGILKDKIINMLGRSTKDAKEPDIKVENTRKAMNITKPTKYIKIPPDL